MTYTATEFRKQLFALMERVTQGEAIEVSYKGAVIRVTAQGASSKLARAKRQHALLVDPQSIVHSDKEMLSEIEGEVERDWAKL